MLGQVVQDLLDGFQGRSDVETVGVWMTAEEGTEEKREERDVKYVVVKQGKEFKLFRDEKYFIDEGGSKAANDRLNHIIRSTSASSYKDTRNGLLGDDYSTKISAYLSLGTITARQVHASLLSYEDGTDSQYSSTPGFSQGENQGTAAIRFELLWRDYMRLCTRKFGPRLFHLGGFRNDSSYPWKSPLTSRDPTLPNTITRFLLGRTGLGLIDASQLELLHTGYTSNRARQNVASFLAKHLGIDWRLGAEWYEYLLVDYDVSSNWGNWQYVSGVGNDPRGSDRKFNPVKQGIDYDSNGEYIKSWIKELRPINDVLKILQPGLLTTEEKKSLSLNGLDWVEKPLVRIEFRVEGKAKKRSGGSSRGKSAEMKGRTTRTREKRRGGGGGGGGGNDNPNPANDRHNESTTTTNTIIPDTSKSTTIKTTTTTSFSHRPGGGTSNSRSRASRSRGTGRRSFGPNQSSTTTTSTTSTSTSTTRGNRAGNEKDEQGIIKSHSGSGSGSASQSWR
ncbi:putative cryptochrome dash [Phaeomoniella chlamydospora]|uniref:Cryptochrome DASH n=1 Tax=Phaeomoniella chlamydospora TaxID=158046 RepID=A0A0G2DYZ4_PHACM|nr:putative cryptochrome dash [Phaeomoniella chlamydospora]